MIWTGHGYKVKIYMNSSVSFEAEAPYWEMKKNLKWGDQMLSSILETHPPTGKNWQLIRRHPYRLKKFHQTFQVSLV